MDRTKIEWTDATWNPITGCTEVSPGCDHCYAKTFAERWRGTPGHAYEQGFDVTLRPERLSQPLRWSRPRRVFVNSMSDLFHASIPDSYIAQVFAVMAAAERHTFQVLTKRHGRMRSLLNSEKFQELVDLALRRLALDGAITERTLIDAPSLPLPNVWLGVSVEDQQRADLRVHALLSTPAAVRFISAEPLLGPVTLGSWLWRGVICSACPPDSLGHERLDWIIVGGESGPGARPMHPVWARQLRDECNKAGVPYLFKQWGIWMPVEPSEAHRGDLWLTGDGVHTQPWTPDDEGAAPGRWDAYGDAILRKVPKQVAGRTLDGRTWDEYPTERQPA